MDSTVHVVGDPHSASVAIQVRLRRMELHPTVLFVHGGPGLTDYSDQVEPELSEYAFASYTQRGPDPSHSIGPFDEAAHLRDLIAVITNTLGPRRPVVVGHSWGGHLALHLAVERPDLLCGMVLIEPFGIDGDGGQARLAVEMDKRLPFHVARRANDLDERALGGSASDADLRESMALFWSTYYANSAKAPPMPIDMGVSATCYGSTMRSMASCTTEGALVPYVGDCRVPTVLMAGDQSPMGSTICETLTSVMPEAQLMTVPDAGHFPWFEAPGSVKHAIESLLGRIMRPDGRP